MSHVPVQIDETFEPAQGGRPPVKVLCGTCTKCGKRAECEVSPDREDGSPATRRQSAVAGLLEAMTEQCEERIAIGDPPGIAPHHYDRVIPRGLRLFQRCADGREIPVRIASGGRGAVKRKVLHTIVGECGPEAVILVVPDAQKFDIDAINFAVLLRKKMGHPKAISVSAGMRQLQVVANG